MKSATTLIHKGAFFNHYEIAKVSIPSTVKSLGERVFSECSSLTSVSIPNSVTQIGSYAFSGCSSLTSVSIPNSVTQIGSYAFSGCTSLTSVSIPNSVTTIEDGAFSGCTSLTSVSIPNSVTILFNTFSGCSSLTSVSIPNSVTDIGWRAFYGCTSLTSITIPNSIGSISDRAFGYYRNALGQENKVSGFTISGYYGTMAEVYANDNGFTFIGTQSSLSDVAYVNGIDNDYTVVYTGSEIKFNIEVGYKYEYIRKSLGDMAEGTDYTISYSNNGNAGTATITITGINHFTDTITKTFKIVPINLNATITLSGDPFEYTGSEIKPSVTVVRNTDNKTLTEGTDYTVSYSNNINVGRATITITGINNYKGIQSTDFNIVKAPESETEAPVSGKTNISKTPSSVKAKVKKNKVTVSWKNIKKTEKAYKQIKTVEVQYSTDKKFKKNVKTKRLAKSKTKIALTLKKNTTYYIRLRYVGNDKKIVSKWTKPKKVKTKK